MMGGNHCDIEDGGGWLESFPVPLVVPGSLLCEVHGKSFERAIPIREVYL
jgi:hypothetical protein